VSLQGPNGYIMSSNGRAAAISLQVLKVLVIVDTYTNPAWRLPRPA